MKPGIKDPVSTLTHAFGALAAIPVTILLVRKSVAQASIWHAVSFIIFGTALFLLYTASSVYHFLNVSEKVSIVLKRIDHMMIFVLIAGSYTPVCLLPLRGAWGWTILALVWALAIGGIVLKALWIDAPRWLSTLIYVVMGWVVVVAFYPLVHSVSTAMVWLLVLGGVMYTAGAVLYAFKWPGRYAKVFGFHELFHLFVLGGSTFHIVFMFML